MDWFRRFMTGRYGVDQLCWAMMVLYLVLALVNGFFRSSVFALLEFVLIMLCFFRMFSRNIYRRAAENRKFLELTGPLTGKVSAFYRQLTDREHRYYRCPGCRQTLRVPRGRGKLEIRCPRCGKTQIRKT